MARATLKLKNPITDFDIDLEENQLEVLGYKKIKTGKWEWNGHNGFYYCSECGCVAPGEDQYGDYISCSKFCYNCGAEMNE